MEEVEPPKQLLLGNSLTIAASWEHQQWQELLPTNITNSIERTSNCLSELSSHNMWAALQDMETALVHILQIDAVQRFSTNIWEIVVFRDSGSRWEWHRFLSALTLCQHERRAETRATCAMAKLRS